MTFRTRLTIALAVVALVPLALAGFAIRREVSNRLANQADRRVTSVVQSIRRELDRDVQATRSRLRSLAAELQADNRFRTAMSGADRTWLLDWAGPTMDASGLAMLMVQDSAGRVMSSGQFRNEYDRMLPSLPNVLARVPAALVLFRVPAGARLALATVDSFTVGGRRFTVVGGTLIDSARVASLSQDGELEVRLSTSGEPTVNVVERISFPYLDPAADAPPSTGWLAVSRDPGPMRDLRRNVDRMFLLALVLTLGLIIGAAFWLGRRISEPLAVLAMKTEELDLDRLDQAFPVDRSDEIGALGRGLDRMSGRLRQSAIRLRDAERRAALGDFARQINHDVKNGLVPIRNVVRHLTQVAERDPDRMAEIYRERQVTLESSIEYLSGLARNYARLSPGEGGGHADANGIAAEIARGVTVPGIGVDLDLAPGIPPVRADSVILRRVVENLVTNAAEALDGAGGRIGITTRLESNGDGHVVRIAIRDTGRGMSREELDRAFEDFYTTKPNGTGLGLSVVRRLVGDLGGTIRVETAPGQGSTFTVEIPAA